MGASALVERAAHVLFHIGTWCLIVGLSTLGLCFPRLCKARNLQVRAWDQLFRTWIGAFNSKVLEPKGIFLKSQSVSWKAQLGDNGESREYPRWLSFAFGPAARGEEVEGAIGEIGRREAERYGGGRRGGV